jgi:hypothetical protein
MRHILITRRRISSAAGLGLIAASSFCFGQSRTTRRRVGALTASSEALAAPFLAALKQGMRELGWQEGKDIEYRFVYANGTVERYDALIAELLAQQVDVIVVTSTQACRRHSGPRKRCPSS